MVVEKNHALLSTVIADEAASDGKADRALLQDSHASLRTLTSRDREGASGAIASRSQRGFSFRHPAMELRTLASGVT